MNYKTFTLVAAISVFVSRMFFMQLQSCIQFLGKYFVMPLNIFEPGCMHEELFSILSVLFKPSSDSENVVDQTLLYLTTKDVLPTFG